MPVGNTFCIVKGFTDKSTEFKGVETSITRREKKVGRNWPFWSLRTAFFDETQLDEVYTHLKFAPNHLIYYPRVRLYKFNNFGRNVLFNVVGYGNTVIAQIIKFHGSFNRLN